MNFVKTRELFMSDVIVKKLFSSENGQKYLAKIICTVLNMPEDSVSFKVIHPDIGINKNVINSQDRKSTRLNSSHWNKSRMPSSA